MFLLKLIWNQLKSLLRLLTGRDKSKSPTVIYVYFLSSYSQTLPFSKYQDKEKFMSLLRICNFSFFTRRLEGL